MSKLSRCAYAFLAFTVAALGAAAQVLPPELEALRAKAESGNGVAQYNLGLAYAEGRDVPQDTAEAYVWLMLAADHGGGTGKSLDSLLARMSSEELAEGKRRLAAARVRFGLPAPISPIRVTPPASRPKPAPTSPAVEPPKAEKPAAEANVPFTPEFAPDPEVVKLRARVKELEDNATQQAAATQKLNQLLNDRAAQLDAAQRSLRETKGIVDSQNASKAAELTMARQTVQGANASIEKAKRESAGQIADLESNLAKRTSEVESLTVELTQARKSSDAAKAEAADAKNQLDSKEAARTAELATARQSLEDAKAEAANVKNREASWSASLEKELAARTAEAEGLRSRVASDEAALKAAGDSGAKAQSLTGELERTRADLGAARTQLAESERASEAAKAQAGALSGKIAANEAQLKTLSEANAKVQSLSAELASAWKELDAAHDATSDAKRDATSQTAAFDQIRNDRDSARLQLAEAVKAEDAAKAQSADLLKKISIDEAQLKVFGDSNAKVQSLSAELASAWKDLDAANKLAAGAKQGAASQNASLDQARAERDAARQQLAAALKVGEAAKTEAADTRTRLEAQGAATSADLAKARNDLASANAQLEQQRKRADALAANVAADEAVLKGSGETNAKVQALAAELAATRQNLEAANAAAANAAKQASAQLSSFALATNDLAAAKGDLAQANKDAENARAETSRYRTGHEADVGELAKLRNALATTKAQLDEAHKASSDSGAKTQALAAELAAAKHSLEVAENAQKEAAVQATLLDQARGDRDMARALLAQQQRDSAIATAQASAQITALEQDVAKRTFDAQTLSSKLAADEAALKAAGDSGTKAQALAADLASTHQALEAANAAGRDSKKEADAQTAALVAANTRIAQAQKYGDADKTRIASLQSDLANRSNDVLMLRAKVAADEQALKAAGDDGTKRQAMATDLSQTKNELAATRNQLAQAQKDGATNLELAHNNLAAARSQLAQAGKDADSAKAQASIRIAALDADLSKRTLDNERLSARLASNESALKAVGDSGSKARALTADLDQARGDVNSLKTQLAQAQKEADGAKGDLSAKDASLQASQNDLAALRTRLAQAEKERDDAKTDATSRIGILTTEAAKRAADAASSVARLTADEVALKTAGEAGSKAQALTSELERSKEAIRTITAQLDKAEKDRDAAKRAADARFDALEADQAARATESRTLNSKLAADEAALKAAGDSGAKAQALAAEFEQAKDDANSVRTHLAQAQRAADAAKGDLASKDAALESAQKDLLASRTELTRAQKERDATKADADSRIAELEATQSARAADAKTLASKLASDEAALKAAGDSGTKTQAAAAQLARAQDDLASTRAQLTQAEKERDGAKSDAATRIAALEADQAARANDAKALATKEASDEAALKAAGDAGTRAQALAGELETTRGDLQTARAQLAQARKDAEGAKAAVPQVAGLQQQNTRLTADKAALEDKLARAVEEANAARAAAARAAGEAGGKAQALAGELSRTKNNLEAARTELVQVRKDETAAKAGPAAQVATLQASAAHLTDENADLRDRLAKAEEAAKSARTTVAGSADLSARVQALEAEIGKNDHDIDVAHYLLTHALRNAAEAKATYESQDSARNAELASLRQEVAAATAAAERATRGAAAPDASASNSRALTDALQRAQNDLLTTRAQLAETQRNEESSRAEAGSASAERSALERQVADLTERLAAANRITSVALDDGGRLRRPTAPQRPYASVSAIPSGTTAAASSAPAPEQRTHTVVEGDTLTKISLEYYGTARRWQSIFQANRDVVSNEEILSIGTVLRIP